MRYVEARPGPELLPFVECLWLASDRQRRSTRQPQRILPDGCPELIVHVGDTFSRLRRGRWNPQHDFPQRILYWLDEKGALHARIEGTQGARTRSEEWVWAKVL